MIDASAVSKEIKRAVFPELQKLGFTKFSGRNAWYLSRDTIQVVNFQSFSNHVAGGVGCTTFSFAVNLGVYFTAIDGVPEKLPSEYQCHLRNHLRKGINQSGLFTPFGSHTDKDREDVWYVFEDGSNVSSTVNDALGQIMNNIEWLNQVSDPLVALRFLATQENRNGEDYGGNIGSPKRLRYIEALQKSLS